MLTLDESGLLRDLFEALNTGVVVVDADLNIRGWNRWMALASRRSADEVAGASLLEVFPEIVGGAAEAAFRRAVTGESVVFAHRFHGYLLPLPCESVPGFDAMQQSARIVPLMRNGHPEGALAIIEDVSERVAREQELHQAMEIAEAASQAKSQFLAITSHELRTPLTAVIGYADLLDNEIGGPISERQREFLGRIKMSTWHLLSLIDEILTFSRLEAGKEEVNLEPCDLLGIVREAILLVEPQAVQKGLDLRVCLPDDSVTMITDSRKVRQILLNVLNNAVKFTDKGHVELEAIAGEKEVVCHVRDTGPGVHVEDQARIFEAFAQADETITRQKGGTGLGLPVSLQLARLLGGNLTLESVPGQGSTFTLRLPVESDRPPSATRSD